jgi:hypothetical protein
MSITQVQPTFSSPVDSASFSSGNPPQIHVWRASTQAVDPGVAMPQMKVFWAKRKSKDSDDRKDRAAERQDDLPENAPFTGAVNSRRFAQFLGNGA